MPSAAQQSSIRELVRRFHVYWNVWPEYIFIKHEKRQIGFELDLSGTFGDGGELPEPGCEKCHEIYRALVQIAEGVLPRGKKDTSHQFEPYDQSIHYSARHGNRPEVVLRIRIIHRQAFERPVDAAQLQYLNELQQNLEERGASQH
jgi:hypothetical protein